MKTIFKKMADQFEGVLNGEDISVDPLDSELAEEAVKEEQEKDEVEIIEEMLDRLPQTKLVHIAEKAVDLVAKKYGLRLYKWEK